MWVGIGTCKTWDPRQRRNGVSFPRRICCLAKRVFPLPRQDGWRVEHRVMSIVGSQLQIRLRRAERSSSSYLTLQRIETIGKIPYIASIGASLLRGPIELARDIDAPAGGTWHFPGLSGSIAADLLPPTLIAGSGYFVSFPCMIFGRVLGFDGGLVAQAQNTLGELFGGAVRTQSLVDGVNVRVQ